MFIWKLKKKQTLNLWRSNFFDEFELNASIEVTAYGLRVVGELVDLLEGKKECDCDIFNGKRENDTGSVDKKRE